MKKWVIIAISGMIIFTSCQKEQTTVSTGVAQREEIRFVSRDEIEVNGGYLLKEEDAINFVKLLSNDPEIISLYNKGQGGLEFPIPCDKLIKYLEQLIGISLKDLQCNARGKLMIRPSLDLWIAANLAYAISLGGYIGAAGVAGFSGSVAGTQAIGVFTVVEVNNMLDTIMWSYQSGGGQHVAFTATAVIWTSETGGVTINLITDHHFDNGTYSWDPILTASYSFGNIYVKK